VARILLIDDDAATRLALRGVLDACGHDVVTAADGEEGLDAFRANSFDIVITDIIMPGKEGIATIREIRQENPAMPIIAISGGGVLAGLRYLEVATKLGANRTLAKPFSTERLLQAIDACLGPTPSPSAA